jgi:hypothetical protein
MDGLAGLSPAPIIRIARLAVLDGEALSAESRMESVSVAWLGEAPPHRVLPGGSVLSTLRDVLPASAKVMHALVCRTKTATRDGDFDLMRVIAVE